MIIPSFGLLSSHAAHAEADDDGVGMKDPDQLDFENDMECAKSVAIREPIRTDEHVCQGILTLLACQDPSLMSECCE